MSLSFGQKQIAKSTKRFRVVGAGRRFGKTHLSIRELCKAASQPDQLVWYVSPSYRQSKQTVWKKLKKRLLKLRWVKRVNESELSIELVNNSTIALKGADNYDSLRGVGLNFVVLDECADIHQEAWTEVLRPTLSDTGGSALFIGTPKGVGNWFYDLFMRGQGTDPQWDSWQFTTLDGGRVPLEEIEAARRDLDERTFKQEYEASFESFTGLVYYNYSPATHIQPYTGDTPRIIHCGIDFNVNPGSVTIAVQTANGLHVIDEIVLYSTNTQEMADELKQRYPDTKIFVYPDPAGHQRKTSALGKTDISILQDAGFVVKAPRSHTPVRDRINAVNSLLMTATGEARLIIDPRCKKTLEGLAKQTYKEGTMQPDKSTGLDHMVDALGYLVDYMFPVKRTIEHKAPQRWGHAIA